MNFFLLAVLVYRLKTSFWFVLRFFLLLTDVSVLFVCYFLEVLCVFL